MSSCKDKKCPKDKVCNPASGRCVLKSGKIGKTLQTKQYPKSPKLKRRSPERIYISPRIKYKHNEPEIVSFSPGNVGGLLSFNIYYSSKYNKNVYILGEVHHKEYKCSSSKTGEIFADDFFFKLINSADNDRFLDVFLEVGYKPLQKRIKDRFDILKEQDEFDQGYLARLLKKLNNQGCGADEVYKALRKSKCPYENIRFHSSDIRQENDAPVIEYLQTILDYVNYCVLTDEETLKNCKSDYNTIMYYDKYTDREILKKDIRKVLHDTKIIRQFDAIPETYKEVKDYLWKTYENALQKYIKTLTFDVVSNRLKEIRQKYGYRVPEDQTHYIKRQANAIEKSTDFISILMDLYLSGRLFRNFRDIKGKYSGTPKNIIIYTGDYHALNYCKMLEKLGFTRVFGAKRNGKSCLDLSGLKQVMWL